MKNVFLHGKRVKAKTAATKENLYERVGTVLK